MQRGGRCLIPVFALGRAQELLLILGAYLYLFLSTMGLLVKRVTATSRVRLLLQSWVRFPAMINNYVMNTIICTVSDNSLSTIRRYIFRNKYVFIFSQVIQSKIKYVHLLIL